MLQILIFHDEEPVAFSLKRELEAAGYSAIIATSERYATELVEKTTINLLIVNTSSNPSDALELCKVARQVSETLPIIYTSPDASLESKLYAYKIGVDSYLIQPVDSSEILAKVKIFLKRAKPATSTPDKESYVQMGDLRLDFNQMCAYRGINRIDLTPKEFDLLHFLIKKGGSIASKEELVNHVWSERFGVSENTVEVYISLLRSKIDKGYDHKYIQTKAGFGYFVKV